MGRAGRVARPTGLKKNKRCSDSEHSKKKCKYLFTKSRADPYRVDTDPDPGSEKFFTDPDPGRTLMRIRIQAKGIRIRI